MAIFRKVHTSFWSDSFISDLSNDQKLFYLYLLTNERTRQCGIYEITKKQMSFDLGYTMDRVSILLKYFISKGKIKYNEDTKEIAIKNWQKFNQSTSPKVKSCIDKELLNVKDRVLIEYIYSMDTQSQEEQEKEEEQEEEKDKPIVSDVVLHPMQEYISKNYPIVSKMKSQLTFDEATKLHNEYDPKAIKEILDAMENYKDILKKNSVYLTIKNWIRRNQQTNPNFGKREQIVTNSNVVHKYNPMAHF